MYRLKLLGGVLLDGPDGPVSGRATQQRRLALLALVGSAGDRGRSRDQLISVLWPETDPGDARQHLSHSLYALRQALGEDAVRTAGEYVRLSSSRVEVDTRVFEGALERGDRAAAVGAYAGPFMEGFFIDDAPEFERWIDEERRRLAKLYIGAVEEAAAEADRAGDAAAAIIWWGRLIDQDPYNSAAVVRLMEALCTTGDPANALIVAREHGERLKEDLGVEPTTEVEALAASIQHGEKRGPKRERRDEAGSVASEGIVPRPPVLGIPVRALAWSVAAVVVVVLAVVWFAGRSDSRGREIPANSLAVLPFLNLTGDSTAEHLVDGVTDQLIAVLSRVPDLRVPAQTSSFYYKGRPQDVRSIADTLGVRTILEGSVALGDSGFRQTAQLIDAETGYHLWTETYELERDEILGYQEEVARKVVAALAIGTEGWVAPVGASSRDPAARQDYAKARHWWNKRTPAGTDTAIAYFTGAVEEDPDWALAWSGLADAYLTGMFWDHVPANDSIQAAARSAASRAVQLDSTLAEARTSYAAVLGDIEGDHEKAARELERAIELNPNYAVAHMWYGETLFMRLGRYEEGLRALRRAYELDPLSPIVTRMLADFLWWSPGGAEEAVRYYDLALSLEPDHWPNHTNRAKALACLGRDGQARAALALLLEEFPAESRAQLAAADILSTLREYDEAGRVVDQVRQDFPAETAYSNVFLQVAIGVYVELGRYADAMAEYRALADLIRSHSPNTLAATLAWIYARAGDEEAARTVLASIPEDKQYRRRARVLAALGDHDEALDILERTVTEQGVLWEVACLGAEPDFDAARENPRYIRLMELIGQAVGD
ncbi:MAG: tetratricopeptide repeat protein [Gemmatimonadota bacterium]